MGRKIVPFVLACSLAVAWGVQADDPAALGFGYSQTVTFRGYAGASALTDFPVLVKLPKRCFRTFSYRDVLFRDAAGNELACDVDSSDDTSVLFWVKLPTLSGTTTTITAWFGLSTAYPTALEPSAVWSRYAGVWHFNAESPDATVHALPYTTTDNITVVVDNGLLGRGFLYESATANQTGVLAQSPHEHLTDQTKFSLSGWFKPESSPPTRATRLLAWKSDHFRGGLDTFQNTNGKLYIRGNDGNGKIQTLYPLDWETRTWSHLAVGVDGGTFTALLNGQAIDGAEVQGAPVATFDDAANVGWIGFGNMGAFADGTTSGDFAYPFKGGEVDELRVFDGVMTEDWAAAEYATVANHDAFTLYGTLETLGSEEVDHDGVWISAAPTATWLDTANWQDGQPLAGMASALTFNSPASVETQTVSLNDTIGVSSIVQQDAARRTIADGRFAFADAADVTVAAGGTLDLARGLTANSLEKKGAGALVLNGSTALLGVRIAAGELVYRAPADTVLTTDFTPAATTYLTHLAVADGTTFPVRALLSSVAWVEATEETEAHEALTLVAQTRFTAGAPGWVRDGYRYLRLPQPIALKAGTTYRATASDGRAAQAIISTLQPEQKVRGTLEVAEGATFTMETPSVTVQQLAGAGTVQAGTEPSVLVAAIAAGENRFEGSFAGPLALRKEGDGTLALSGTGLFPDGVYVKKGTLLLASPETLAPGAPVSFNDFTGANAAGVLSVEGDEVTLANPFHALRTSTIGMSAAGVRARPGQTLTIAGTAVTAPDAEVLGRQAGEFALHAFADAEGHDPTIVFRSNMVDYVDFIARVDGLQDSLAARPNNKVVLDSVETTTRLRKLVVQNNARRSLGGTVDLTGGNVLTTDYLDFTGAQVKMNIKDQTTLVAPNIRIADSSPNWETIDESNVDLTVEEGSLLAAKGFPAPGSFNNTRNCTNSVLRLDGGTFQVTGLTGDSDVFPAWTDGQPQIEVTAKGGTLDMRPYGGGNIYNLWAKTPIRSPEGATTAPLTINGGSLPAFVVDAAMTYAGPTTLDAVVLRLNKRLCPGSDILLANGSKIFYTPDDDLYLKQNYGTLAAEGDPASTVVNTQSGEILFEAIRNLAVTKRGAGTLGLALGLTEAPVMEAATVTVEEGSLRLGGIASGKAEMALVADGGFEPATALPSDPNNRGPNDKRGTRDASYLASNFPTWAFASGDASGICGSVSYFSEASQFANEPEDNRHCAFLFVKNNQPGTIYRSFEVAQDGDIYELEYRVASRYYGGTTYGVKISALVDGEEVDVYPAAGEDAVKSQAWITRHVLIGPLSRGTHQLCFTIPNEGSLGVLLDNVKLGFSSVVCGNHLRGLSVDLKAGTTLDLDFDGQVTASGLMYDGKRVYGHINATNNKAFVTGRGTLHIKGGGCAIILR